MNTPSGTTNLGEERPAELGRAPRWARLRAQLQDASAMIGSAIVGSAMAGLVGACLVGATRADATPTLVIDARTGGVLYESEATTPWYPASLTKLMTAYVALDALRARKISLDTPLVVSQRAVAAPPSKMGFKPGTFVTLDNALKMLMVKSANDIAVTIAEGIAGSVEAFAEDMNAAAARLGMTRSHFVNPNGLQDPKHVSSARDMALLAQALVGSFPEYGGLFSIEALRLGDDIIKNHNHMLGHYPGVDGMKTGFTCPAGFNLVASANRDGRKIIAVVLGAPNVEQRTVRTAVLFDRAFAGIDRATGHVASLPDPASSAPPDMRAAICRNPAVAIAAFAAVTDRLSAPLLGGEGTGDGSLYAATSLVSGAPMASRMAMVPRIDYDPVPVYVGAPEGYAGLVARARPAHSPIGTEGPPETVQAYASSAKSAFGKDGAPLLPDHAALPMKGQRRPVRGASGQKPAQNHAAVNAAKVEGQAKAAPAASRLKVQAAPQPPSRPYKP
jgi:D-alanyl-D-alanine carboxypeptidase